jgi:hypothetical protein
VEVIRLKEVREWIQLLFVVVGGSVALVAYFQNLRQRRVENALKFIALFRDGLKDGDLQHWEDLFRASSELAGAKRGMYLKEWEEHASIGDYFSEGAPDSHAVARMAQSLDVVCHQVVAKTADARTVYYELGQLLDTMHSWLGAVEAPEQGRTLLDSHPSIKAFYAKHEPQKKQWPSRVYAYIE